MSAVDSASISSSPTKNSINSAAQENTADGNHEERHPHTTHNYEDPANSLITQVQKPSDLTLGSKTAVLDAAKKRVQKLEVIITNSSTNDSRASDSPSTPGPPSPHTIQALSVVQAGHQTAPPVSQTIAKANFKKSETSWYAKIFQCCLPSSASDDHHSVPMKPVKGSNDGREGHLKVSNGTGHHKSKSLERRILLKPLAPEDVGKKCLVLDLDETLVHSSFKPVSKADFIIPVEIDKTVHNVYVLKRPGVDEFLHKLGSQFEVVVFTASLAKYADPVLDTLDVHNVVKHRLFREACVHHNRNFVKDLSILGRDLKDVIIIDNSPSCYMFHPKNAIPITSWFDDGNDTELYDLIPFLEDLKKVEDVTTVLDNAL